jgi:acetyltransferase-like isoleucine patch superfamily enzyme
MAATERQANNVFVSSRAHLGTGVRLGTGVKLYGEVVLGNDVWLDSGVVVGYPTAEDVARLRSGVGDVVGLDAEFDAVVTARTVIEASSFVRTGSVIYSGVDIGPRLDCAHHVIVREGSRLGRSVELGPFAYVKRDCVIGDHTRIAAEICDRTVVGAHCSVYGRTSHAFVSGVSGVIEEAPVLCDGVVVGRDAVVIGNVEVGELAYVAAGAVVTHSVGAETVVAGNPARLLRARRRDEAVELWDRVRR